MARAETVVDVDGRRLRMTNLDKVLYPQTGTTKADVARYYAQVADVMVPHCTGRPVTRKRWVDGVGTARRPKDAFFSKDSMPAHHRSGERRVGKEGREVCTQ